MNMEDAKNLLLNIKKFNLWEAFNSSNGKTQMSYICALMIVICGCALALMHPEHSTEALGMFTVAVTLLGVHAVTPTKEITAPNAV
jgi:Na+/melibiose symporter-like transporter